MRKIDRDIVSVMIISKDNKIFLGKKHSDMGGVYVDCWHLPGGGVDEGERLEQALYREISEEIGIDIHKCTIKLIDDQGRGRSEKTLKTGEKVLCNMNFNVFKVKINQNAEDIKVKIGDDLGKYQWLDLIKLDTQNLTPPSVDLFTRLGLMGVASKN